MVAKYLVPALAVAGRAIAQSSCTASATLTIQNQGDATGIAGCPTFEGSIEIAAGTTGSIAIDGVEEITGSLSSFNASGLTALSAGSLTMIGKDFALGGAILLSQLTMPELTDVGGKIMFSSLNALQNLQFTNQIKTAGELDIDDTQLYSLTGINLERVGGDISITSNGFLTDITMQIANVSGAIEINNNAGGMCNVTFPNLIWAESINIMNVQSFLAPSLESTNSSLTLSENTITSFSAANLTTVGSALSITSNPELSNLSLPILTTINSDLRIVDNQAIEKIDGFPVLSQIVGAVNISGSMTEIDFPALRDVKGTFFASSSGDITSSCDTFKKENGQNSVIKGKVTCSAKAATPTSTGSPSGGSGSGSGNANTSSGAANPVVITGATGLLGVVAAIFGML